MSSPFSRVVVVLNPNSTGDGPSNARELRDELSERAPALTVDLVETQHAGHAEDLAYDAVTTHDDVLVVSASGDGGYHEVVNGVVRAGREGATSGAAAVLPSGNANDHATAVQGRPLVEAIVAGARTRLDLLEVRAGDVAPRVAHSYVGVGITPVAAAALNEHHLDAVKETVLVARTFWHYRPLTIRHDGRDIDLDSLVFANIDRMAKYATIDEDSAPDDGRYETLLIRHRSKLRLVADFTRVLRGKHEVVSRSEPYTFTTYTPMPLQLDGEVMEVDGGTDVVVRCLPRALKTVV
ncbi:diacylglycerol/lipid kinase family protein [Kineococcus rubinsiae]|uniref:diacylglycerol/lipid kinase family protein n=1 Tax=Kineococcus rubinsiae TaxID=2609562 RepID=UPI00142FD523|nr:diacylglycerol kinase family protein [Kineococcus rubinsiae]NIZ90455.1 diacylglycerol kinase [Kineococcus rubinsiae]